MTKIPTRTHGALDFFTAALLVALPRLLGWKGQRAAFMCEAAVLTLAYSLVTRYEWGAVKLLPMRAHLAFDGASGLWFCWSPLRLRAETKAAQRLLVAIGLFELLVTFCSQAASPLD